MRVSFRFMRALAALTEVFVRSWARLLSVGVGLEPCRGRPEPPLLPMTRPARSLFFAPRRCAGRATAVAFLVSAPLGGRGLSTVPRPTHAAALTPDTPCAFAFRLSAPLCRRLRRGALGLSWSLLLSVCAGYQPCRGRPTPPLLPLTRPARSLFFSPRRCAGRHSDS